MPRLAEIPASHLTFSQAATFVGVSPSAVWQRADSGALVAVDVFGTKMLAVADLRRWKRERLKVARANLAQRIPR
jgi:hypothetical protein